MCWLKIRGPSGGLMSPLEHPYQLRTPGGIPQTSSWFLWFQKDFWSLPCTRKKRRRNLPRRRKSVRTRNLRDKFIFDRHNPGVLQRSDYNPPENPGEPLENPGEPLADRCRLFTPFSFKDGGKKKREIKSFEVTSLGNRTSTPPPPLTGDSLVSVAMDGEKISVHQKGEGAVNQSTRITSLGVPCTPSALTESLHSAPACTHSSSLSLSLFLSLSLTPSLSSCLSLFHILTSPD